MCLVVSLLLAVLPISAMAANQDGYIGPIEPPEQGAIEISTAEELYNIRNNLSGSYVLAADIDLSSYSDWSPIGFTTGSAFRGTLDGQGHKITGLTVSEVFDNATLLSPSYAVGLFGVCDGATIKNLTVEGVDVSVVTSSGYGYVSSPLGSRNTVFAGGLAGFLTGGCQVYNCYTSGTVLAQAYEEGYSDTLAGGIAGYIDDSTLLYCGSSCSVEAYNDNLAVAQDSMAGGLAGAVCGDSAVDRSYNSGAVQALTGNYGVAYAGGLIGYSETTAARVSNCFNEGAVTAMAAAFSGNVFCDDAYAGGISGYYAGLTDRCYNSGIVHAQANDDYGINDEAAYAGGMTGGAATDAVISNCASVQPSVSASAGDEQYCRIACGGTKSNNATVSRVSSGSQNDADLIVSEEEARGRALYADSLGWDFSSVWEMVSGKDFPQLKQNTGSVEGGDAYFQWSLEGGLLLIAGDGPMPDWGSPLDVPWYDRASEVTQVRIADGITTVGDWAFFWCRNLERVTVGSGVTRIGDGAFTMCESLERLELPAGVAEVGTYAFANSGLTGMVFQGAAPEIGINAWENVKAVIGYYSDRGGWEDATGESYGGSLTWTDLYQQENGLIEVSAVKLSYDKKEGSIFDDKTLPGVPSTNISQYAEELFLWAQRYGYDDVLTEEVCGELVRDYMPTVVYAEDGVTLIEEEYKTWEIMRDVLMINSAKDSINQWENGCLRNVQAVNLTEAQEQLSRIIAVYAAYAEETERNPVANALYNIYALPFVQDAGAQVWKVSKEYLTGDIIDNLNAGDFQAIVTDALEIRAAWKEDGIDSLIGSGQLVVEDILEDLKENFVKDFTEAQMKEFIWSIVELDPTLADLHALSEEISSYVKSFKTYSLVAEFAPGILFQVELLKMGKLILDTIDQVKEAQFFMLQYDTLRNHSEDYDLIMTEAGEPVDPVTLALREAEGLTLTDFQRELLNLWYDRGGQHLVEEEQRITLTSLASTAVTLQNMTPSAMQERIVAYWAAEVKGGSDADRIYQVQYTLDGQSSFQVMDTGSDTVAGSYTPDGGYTPASSVAVFSGAETAERTDMVYVSGDEAGNYVTVSVRNPAYSVQVEEPSAFVLVDVLTRDNTSYSAVYESTQGQTLFSLRGSEISAQSADGALVAPSAVHTEEESIAAQDAAGLQILYQGDDTAERVTEDLILPQTGDLGSAITWSSSNEAVVGSTGAVVRGEEEQTVLLTAAAAMGEFSAEKTFSILVAGKKIVVTLLDADSGEWLGQIEASVGDFLTEEMVPAHLPEGTGYAGCFYDVEQEYPYYGNQALDRSLTLYIKTEAAGAEETELTISGQPQDASYSVGEAAQALTVTYVSNSDEVTFQWYAATSPDLRDGTAIDGAAEASYVPPTDTAGTTYYYVVLTAGEVQAVSDSAAVVVTEEMAEWSGSFGDGLTWSLDTAYHLTISGTGPMPEAAEAPWDAYRDEIRSVQISEGVTSVTAGLLTDLTRAVRIVAADSVTSMAAGAFSGCVSLESLQLPFVGLSREAPGEDGILGILFGRVSSGGTVQYYESSGSQLSGYRYGIPDTLRKVTLTDAEHISFGAFCGCAMLTEIVLNEGITDIGPYSFRDCSGLTELTLPDSLVTVEEYALQGCTALEKLTIPFVGAQRDCEDGYSAVLGILFGGCGDDGVLQFSAVNGSTLSGYYYAIPASLTEVVLTDEAEISLGAFSNCANLTRVELNDAVTALGQYAFYQCTGLTALEIPASVTKMGSGCLSGCTELTVSCYTDTAAHVFCEASNIPYVLLDGQEEIYPVTVLHGTGSGDYQEGDIVSLTADPPAFGQRFSMWSGTDGLEFVRWGADEAEAAFVMPDREVEVAAIYEDMLTVWVEEETLRYRLSLPEGTKAILAVAGYDEWGRVLNFTVIAGTAGSGTVCMQAADYYRAFLLQQDTLLPLSPAWDSRRAAR